MSIPISQFIPPPTFSPGVHYFFPLCPCLYLCFADRISRFCMYVLIYGICFSLSDLLHSVSDSLFTWSLPFSLTCVLKVINIHLKLSPALKFPYFMLNSPISHLHSQLYHPQGKSQKELREERIENTQSFFFFASCFEMTAHFIWNLQKHRNVQNRKIADVRRKQDQEKHLSNFWKHWKSGNVPNF